MTVAARIGSLMIATLLALGTMATPIFAGGRSDNAGSSQIQFAAVVVNGTKLTGPNTSAERRGGRIMIPVAAVAKGLGDTIVVDAAGRNVTVRRQTGATAELNGRLGQIREAGSLILTISNSGEIVFTPNIEELLLPIEIAAALFDASIRYDADKNAVVVSRGQTLSTPSQTNTNRRIADIYQVDYEYNLNSYSNGGSQDLALSVTGRLADGRFHLTSNSSSPSIKRISVRNANFTLERPNGQRFAVGNIGTGAELQFMAANIRGVFSSIPVSGIKITAFGGRTFSGEIKPVEVAGSGIVPLPRIRDRFNYDTTIYGIFANRPATKLLSGSSNAAFSAGAMSFSNSQRSGDLITGNIGLSSSKFTVQSDLGFGRFAGRGPDEIRFRGTGAAVDLVGTFQLTDSLSVQGRYTRLGKNFLSPQLGSREPIDLKAAGISWTPTKWLSTSINASASRRPGDIAQNNKYVTAAFSITPGAGSPRFYFSHTQSSTSQIRSGSFSILNASKDFRKMRLFLNATRIRNTGPATHNVQTGAAVSINDRNSIEATQGIGSRGALNGQIDWRTAGLLNNRLNLSAGVGYSYSKTSGISPYERLTASVNLPRQTSLQVNYYQTGQGPTLMVSLRGSLFKKREAQMFLDSPAAEMNSYGKVSGRVYQDMDQNGKYDAGVDKPQGQVKVRVDGNRYVVTDENGLYTFDSVIAGDHQVYLDLLSVRADLTLLDNAAQQAKLLPGSTNNYDFRLVRTGRLRGLVWFDKNENGTFDEGESPLADVRVITASGRDTLTDSDGYFVIGDLPPGEHVLLIDEKTLPEKTIAGTKPLAVQVFPGRETNEVNLIVIGRPAEVKRFPARTN